MATFVYFILPVILLILGLPIFVVLLLTSFTAIVFVAHVPTDAVQTYMFGSLDNFPLLAVPFFVLGGRDHGPRRHRRAGGDLGGVDHRRRARLAGGDDGGVLGTVRRHGAYLGGHRRRHRAAVVSVADQARLQRALRHQPDHLLGRGRGDHPAVDRDDPLRHDGGGLRDQTVHRRHFAEPADRHRRRRLCDGLRAHQNGAAVGAGALEEYLGLDQGGELGDRHHRRDLRRHLWRHIHADRSRRRGGGLFAVRGDVRLPHGRALSSCGRSSSIRWC